VSIAGGAATLARLGFSDVDRAGRLLTGAVLDLWDDTGGAAAGSDAVVVAAIAEVADPDLALLALHRIAERAEDRDALLDRLRRDAGLRTRLLGVLGASAAFGDQLVGRPGDWHVLEDDAIATTRPSAAGLRARLLTAVAADRGTSPTGAGRGAARDVTAAVDALRAEYRRALLALAGRDLAGLVDVEDAAGELSDLAAAALTAALAIATAELPPDAVPCRLAIVGMGKCGGSELNYVSDVDVVFVAEPRESTVGEDAALRTATTLAARTIQICGRIAWPVDAGLRPEGASGPLVRTLASHEAYYRRWARTWEFQALLKARPVAGDLDLGRDYVDRLAPLVWTSAEREHFVDDVRAMRRRVADTLPGRIAGRDLKLGRGGLRDVEFAVQLLQLVHGRADPSLRSGTTLTALAALGAGGYVGREDAATLAAAYRFLRVAEHRLQLQHLRRTHLLPEDPAGLRWLARAMGINSGAHDSPATAFQAEHAQHAREVRRLHEKLFYRPLLTAVARVPTEALRLGTAAAADRLAALGFGDPPGALRHLGALSSGVSRRAAIQRTLLPPLLALLADAPDPDAGLLAYRHISEALERTPWFLRLLRDEGTVLERLATLLGSGRYVPDLLARAPEALRLLASDDELVPHPPATLHGVMGSVVGRHDDPDRAADAVRGRRRHELLRIACSDRLGRLDVDEVGRALADIDAATLDAALSIAARTCYAHGPPTARLAVIGMGSFGGRESGYGSDADVMYVYEPVDGADERAAHAAAIRMVDLATTNLNRPAPDPPLRLDTGLRPEGRDGAVARSLGSYAAYYRRWSLSWESQALLRARPVAGDPDLGRRFVELIDPVRYRAEGLPAAEVTEIRRLKARVDAERLPRGADPATHTKLGRGGLADVEWTVQLVQLRHAATVPELRTPHTLSALRAAADAAVLDRSDADALEAAWWMASRARNAVMLVRGRASDQLPRSGADLAAVARVLGYAPGRDPGQFLDDYLRATRRARRVVERVFYGAD